MCNLSLLFGPIWHGAPAIHSIATLNLLILCSSTFKIISRRPVRLWGAIKQDLRCTFYHKLPTTVTTAEWERLYTQRWKTNLNDYTTLILVACCSNSFKSHTVIYCVKRRYDPHRVRSRGKSKIVVFEILESKKCSLGSITVRCNFFEYNFCLDSKLSGFLIILRNVNILPFTNKHTSGY